MKSGFPLLGLYRNVLRLFVPKNLIVNVFDLSNVIEALLLSFLLLCVLR